MKRFLALPALLRSAVLLASASQHSFSPNDDLLAFPQYEIRFQDEWISEEAAQSRLSSSQKLHVQHENDRDSLRDPPPSQIDHYRQNEGASDDRSDHEEEQVEYENLVLDGQSWLCSVPKVKNAAEGLGVNETQTRAEEEKELARATDRGWELLSGMQDNCVFFISGWWSYRFCYNQGVKQFHQLPPSRGVPVYPPMEDPGVPGFMLGTYAKQLDHDDTPKDEEWEGEVALEMSKGAKRLRSGHGELVERGETRYLVQKLGGGTVCDLTGKERKVEVQFHCNPQSSDRISLIKETSTCAYLMVIQTPRLCNDVAFLPPQKDQANPVKCSPVLRADEVEEYERDLKALRAAENDAKVWEANAEAAAALGGTGYEPLQLPVGDIFVGEHRLVPEGKKLEKSSIVGGTGKETYIDTVASSDGRVLGKEDLEKLGLGDPKAVEKLKKELEKIAQGQNWKLDVIDTPRGREYRGIIGDEDEEKEGKGEKGSSEKKYGKDKVEGKEKKESKKAEKAEKGGKPEQEEGSEEEYYKEEL
ncbi:hypothetical protein M409DRAFT_50211 [Zasmidium cellare ATCC 36951]|uniref:Endoplasmic reticulum lectin n=1 Tax=Zasmidium cellare ATCC 36951 TaxID=1080233 RepID=A0A6A6CZ78_ZASCE|nr:uncharacterized protein M409DRAFT_50211 [Zasmidium cellare ATCC 36951]KAF2172527.1 hypothetical protein M409DRAFT_50211 [Zasmidium cellare ATCC 36951]